ncbi:hypothetical protein [Sphingomonas aerolata]|jgi:hypothetical protein|uniref:hypothetical protein n=1 Tax=Sphingomonas aerolata TaxID=185951 RepID=UPI002FE0E032
MKRVARPGLALAAVFPAAMVPIVQIAPVSDFVQGGVVGLLLGASLLLIALAVKLRPA